MNFLGIHSDIAREYDKLRLNAENLRSEREAEVYKRYPRVKEIDIQLAEIGISMARLALGQGKDDIGSLKKESNKLKAEKQAIFEKANIPDDYFTNIYRCEFCSDTGFVINERCKCYLKKLMERLYKLSNVENALKYENFLVFSDKDFDDKIDEIRGTSPKANINYIRQEAEKFINDFKKKHMNFLFYGKAGRGKTFMCHCIIKELIERHVSVLYITISKLCKLFEDYRFNRQSMIEPDEQMEIITNVDLLVIDDLGAEVPTIVTTAALFEVLNERLLSQRAVIISANLTLKDLQEQYTDRITSRIAGSYRYLEFFGDDIRRKQKKL